MLQIFDIINKYNIKQAYVSKSLDRFKNRFITNTKLNEYHNIVHNCIFFGLYNIEDIKILKNHKGIKVIIWGGTDCDPRYDIRITNVNIIKQFDAIHISISEDLHDRLNNYDIKNERIYLSTVYEKIFKPNYMIGTKIFIYNGQSKQNEHIYGKEVYEEIVRRLPEYEFYYSNQLNVPYEKMPEIYSECFVGIRLTTHDGNANTVLEMGLMGLPVIHNGEYCNSIYWDSKNIDKICDDIKHIKMNYGKSKQLISNTMKDFPNKSNIPVIFIPIWKRPDIVTINVELLKLQTIKCNIVLGISNDEDLSLAKQLNVDYVFVKNQPLGYKEQVLIEYCRIYNTKYIVYNGSDDYLSLNYVEKLIKYIDNGHNFVGLNNWFIVEQEMNTILKLEYTNENLSIGSGRILSGDILDKINWQYYPLDKCKSMDYHSFNRIKNIVNSKILNDDTLQIISIKDKHDVISSTYNILNSLSIRSKTIDSDLHYLLYENNLNKIINLFQQKPQSKKYLYITYINEGVLNKQYIMRLQLYIFKQIKYFFDIVFINNLHEIDLNKYDKILLDATSIVPRSTLLSYDVIKDYINKLKNFKIILICHDLHDWSLGLNIECPKSSIVEKGLKPLLYETNEKKAIKNFFEEYNITQIISLYDCPEYNYWKKYFTNITNFNYISHHFDNTIFYRKREVTKKYDILFYGWSNKHVYPFRNRLKNICQKYNLNIKIIKRELIYDKSKCETGLNDLINSSWMCITCTSNYSYFVRKYLEIANGSVILGNINRHGKSILNNNLIELTNSMTDIKILSKIMYYLSNKELLVYINSKANDILVNYSYVNFTKKLINIIEHNKVDEPIITQLSNHKLIKQNIKIIENQNVKISQTNNNIILTLLQNKSTPGIIIQSNDMNGDYVLSYECSEYFETRINCDKYKNYRINNVNYSVFETSSNCKMYALHTKPTLNTIVNIKNINLFKVV
jgi:hypothetical protein